LSLDQLKPVEVAPLDMNNTLQGYKIDKGSGMKQNFEGKDNLKSEGFADYLATKALELKYKGDFDSFKKSLSILCPQKEPLTESDFDIARKGKAGKSSHGTNYDRLEYFILQATGFKKIFVIKDNLKFIFRFLHHTYPG